MSGGRRVTLSWDGGSVELGGAIPAASGLYVTGDGIEGWDSSPDAKVELAEMQTGDGAHAIGDGGVLYSSRVVTVHFGARGRTRDEVLGLLRSLSASCHRLLKIRVEDSSDDTYCTGYSQPSVGPVWDGEWAEGTLTVVCPDPRRYSTRARRTQLLPVSGTPGGLRYEPSGGGLSYDLGYGAGAAVLQNVGTLRNDGNAPAYPVVTVTGPIQEGLRIDWDGGSVAYARPVGGVPLTLDSLSRTASVGGLDVSRSLTSRGFPVVPPGGEATICLQAVGSGWATVEWHDTYV